MNGQKIANILTVLFLLAGLAVVGFFMVTKWSVYSAPIASGGTTIIAGIVAFVVTFFVLIIVTLAIVFLKRVTDRKEIEPIDSKKVHIKTIPKTATTSEENDSELVAVIMSAVSAFRAETGQTTNLFTEFRVREMVSSGSSWRIISLDDLSSSVGG
jgi:Na+-transporting methylmalonyl-CoA/oxaloacetate decarboxylase gamma subunit